MKNSITQEFDFGCAIACIAFVMELNYGQVEELVGTEQACSTRFYVKNIREFLNDQGLSYKSKHVKKGAKIGGCGDNAIVLIRPSKRYPSGHYLVSNCGEWMDPWINMHKNQGIKKAESGYRKRLPGQAMYLIYPYGSE